MCASVLLAWEGQADGERQDRGHLIEDRVRQYDEEREKQLQERREKETQEEREGSPGL